MVSPSNPAPQGERRPLAVIGILMPHLAAGRHHVYRDATALMLLAALVAAGLGSLPVALVLAAVALPAAVLVYIHDHRLWRDEPVTVILVAFGLSLLLGAVVGLLETHLIDPVVLASRVYHLPPVSRILQLGVLVPVAAFVAVVIAPLVVSSRPVFRHPMDVVVACLLSGAAMSLGLSVVVEHGAFTHVQATAGDPAHVAFIALTLGFLQPIVLATAGTLGVLGVRHLSVNPVVGVVQGLVLVVAYELATTLLQPYGTRGIVLTAMAAFVLAGLGLVATRNGLHAAMAADSGAQADTTAPGLGDVDHRLHTGVVTAIVAVVVLVAALVSVAVVWRGPAARPMPPQPGHGGGIVPHPSAASALHPLMDKPGESRLGTARLASMTAPLAVGTATAIDLGNGVTLTLAPGWTISNQGHQWANVFNKDKNLGAYASTGSASTPDINQESALNVNQAIQAMGLTNVQQTGGGQPQTLQGKNFQQLIETDWTGNAQTNQGTQQEWGAWVTLYNATAHTSGSFVIYAWSADAFKAAIPDAGSMLASME